MKKLTRREALATGGALVAGAAVSTAANSATDDSTMDHSKMNHDAKATKQKRPPAEPGTYRHPDGNDWYARTVDPYDEFEPGLPGRDYTPVIKPNGTSLPFKIVDGKKIFHLIPEEITHEFAPGFKGIVWGYNGEMAGPVIEAVEGDHIRIYVTNKLKVPTSVHWHGLLLPCNQDGVSGLTQRPIRAGETFVYDFKAVQHGTFMYHAHKDTMVQEGMGLIGMLVIHPRKPKEPRPDRDFSLMLHEMDIKPGTYRPDTSVASGFNTLTINGKVFPGTEPLVTKLGDRTRIRVGNLSAMDHHPFHIHGHAFRITETDGGVIPEHMRWPETSALVAVGQTRNLEFVTDNPGDWAMHCHMTHHTMNQMGHGLVNMVGASEAEINGGVGNLVPNFMAMGTEGMGGMGEMAAHMSIPENSIPMVGGQGPHAYISMGGMFNILKVREGITSYEDPGWYTPPKGKYTKAKRASKKAMRRDGIDWS